MPAAGWSSWNVFAGGVTAADVMGMADAMVAKGLDKLGYIYVAIDCGWNLHTRDAKGDLQPDPKKFPDGIGAVARYVNGLGDGQLRLGLYSEHDTGDCCGGPGMKGHEDQDAAFYKANGIDYLKVDSCAGHTLTPRAMYNDFVSAAARARGPLDLSISRPLDCAAGVRCWRALLACAGVCCRSATLACPLPRPPVHSPADGSSLSSLVLRPTSATPSTERATPCTSTFARLSV